MRVREVHFNHDRSSGRNDAINLRYDADTVITAPEWVDGEPPKPAAYIRSAHPLTVKVKFSGGPPNGSVQIGAAVSLNDGREIPPLGSTGPGGLKPQVVDFDGAGNSQLIAFEASGDLRNVPVGAYELKWTWRLKHEYEWVDFANTRHRVYVVLAPPTHPWTMAVTEASALFPWVEALEKATDWAAGATTTDDAVEKIARALNSHPKHEYDGDGRLYVRENFFMLSDYLRDLDMAASIRIDCSGITSALVTFANLVGASLCPLDLKNSVIGGLHTKHVETFHDPNFNQQDWGWHEIAVRLPLAAIDSSGGLIPGGLVPVVFDAPLPDPRWQLIYDALLHVNTATPTLPIKMYLGLPFFYGYRFELVAWGNADVATIRAPRPVM